MSQIRALIKDNEVETIMCDWVIVNGQVCKTQEELSLEMATGIRIFDEPHSQPPDDSCLCPVDVEAMAKDVGMHCRRPRPDEDFDMVKWVVSTDPEKKSFRQCFENMKELGPTGWDNLPNIEEALDELR